MQIEDKKVVAFHYTLTNDDGQVIDSSDGGEALSYLHGSGNIIPGLENALLGKVSGDKLKVSLEAEEAYGPRVPEMVQSVPREAFQGIEDIQPGMQFQTEGPEGGVQLVTVTEVADESVTVDGNHPLAGERLHFDVEVSDVREPSAEELEHGHVHGPEGHEH